jgi:hypothetical protein
MQEKEIKLSLTTLSTEAIQWANTGAVLSVIGFPGDTLKDFYMDFNFKGDK